MKKKNVSKKLSLKKFTVSQLNNLSMRTLRGGITQEPSAVLTVTEDGVCSGNTYGGPDCPGLTTEDPLYCKETESLYCSETDPEYCDNSELYACRF